MGEETKRRLLASQAAYQATFDQAAVGIFHCSFDGADIRCNPHFAAIIGYSIEEVHGLSIAKLIAPEELPAALQAIHTIVEGKANSVTWEKHCVRKDGSLLWAKLTTCVQRDSEQNPLHLITFVEDIQALKEAEEQLAETLVALRSTESRYRSIFQTALDAISITRVDDGMFVDVNNAFFDIFGYTREELVEQTVMVPNEWLDSEGDSHHGSFLDTRGRTSLELQMWVVPEERQRFVEIIRQKGVCRDFEARFRKKNGDINWVRLTASAIEIEAVPCIISYSRDIGEIKAAEEELAASDERLRASELRYRTAFQTSQDSVIIARLDDGVVIDANQGFANMIGYPPEEIIGQNLIRLRHWFNLEERDELLAVLRRDKSFRDFKTRFYTKQGEIVWGLISASLIELNGVPCVLSITRDITAAKAAEEKIQSLSFYDTLTNLPNRRLLLERLSKTPLDSAQGQRKKALLSVDLDHFKALNDRFGQPVGDLLLQEVARRITKSVNSGDTVARMGGDQFLVILEDLSDSAERAANQAGTIAEKILAEIDESCKLGIVECCCSASIGVSVFDDRLYSIDEILKQADIAMGHAKTAGGNAIRFFSATLQSAVDARAELETDLRLGLRDGQMLLYYQPQVEGTRLTGAEALIRWRHPARGMMSPGTFIPLAEETGLILPLGDWVLETACRQIATWSAKKKLIELTIGVNISAVQLHQRDFVSKLLGVLERTGADPRCLELELTESVLVENVEDVISKMTDLKAYGIRFSLDDFGTGYSSLSYLKRLPLNKLKIDISFVRDILKDPSSGVIAQTVVALSRAMGLSVIAEGVESEEQRAFLADLGCTAYQGYLFSCPLLQEDFELLLPDRNGSSSFPGAHAP